MNYVGRYAPRVKPRPCYLCSSPLKYDPPAVSSFAYRGETHSICRKCRGEFWAPLEQASKFGKRYRFIRKSEMPRIRFFGMAVGYQASRIAHHRVFTKVFAALILLQDRQKKQRKEVSWMVDDMTRKLLKLPDQIAAVLGKTYVIRGDDFLLSDDVVLLEMKEILKSIDPDIIERNKDKRVIQRWK